jgi:S-adenosylmethionine:tRNA ribosyltransferase-isomerase
VGLGTFQPVRAKDLADIHLHAEHYTLPATTATAINAALAEGRRVIAAGTTTTRTLEHCAQLASTEPFEPHTGLRLHPHSGSTEIFISPGHKFRVVSGLLTNFHLPQSTLLMLVSAFAGREAVFAAYAHAVRERYRFFSYGDCMLLL